MSRGTVISGGSLRKGVRAQNRRQMDILIVCWVILGITLLFAMIFSSPALLAELQTPP